jgi:CubicO group peptidase (beta-lactamase class C family)
MGRVGSDRRYGSDHDARAPTSVSPVPLVPLVPLLPLPPQPAGVPWPTREWPKDRPGATVDADRLSSLVDRTFSAPGIDAMGPTNAILAVHGGVLVTERYGNDTDADTTLPSWSMAKSILHSLVGVLVDDDRLRVDDPAAMPQWQTPGDPRADITLDHLLHMRPGLRWTEDYVDATTSDVIEMLFGSGQADVAAFAAGRPLDHPAGSAYLYSSGTSCIVSALTRQVVGPPAAYEKFMRESLFDRIGMRSAVPKFDDAGTWIGSSYCFATARDFARFGLLQLRGGQWDGDTVLPRAWVDHGRTPQADVDDDGWGYGAHWWMLPGRTDGLFFASGYRGQYLMVVPGLDLVVLRSGDSEIPQRDAVAGLLGDIVACFAG